MDVNEIGAVGGAQPISPVQASPSVDGPAEASSLSPVDEVQISEIGEMLSGPEGASEIRAARLERIKDAIDDGTYETTEKLEAAVSRLFDELQQTDRSESKTL